MTLYKTVQYSTVQYSTVQYCNYLHNAIKFLVQGSYSTVEHSIVLIVARRCISLEPVAMASKRASQIQKPALKRPAASAKAQKNKADHIETKMKQEHCIVVAHGPGSDDVSARSLRY